MTRGMFVILAAATVIFVCGSHAGAHDVRPAFLELTEREPGVFDVLWKVPVLGQGTPLAGEDTPHEQGAPAAADPNAPRTMPCGCPTPWGLGLPMGAMPLHPTFPPDAKTLGPPRLERVAGAEVRRWTIDVGPRGLEAWTCTVHGLRSTSSDVLVRVASLSGDVVTRVLRPASPSFTMEAGRGVPVAEYVRLGVEHILLGPDHLLFVLGLLLIVPDWRMLLKTVTSFTVAHSLTLAAATLGYAAAPVEPLNAAIALSILFLGPEIVRYRRGETSLTIRHPWVVAFAFGLLHGFGFAGGLTTIGLPPGEVSLALLMFNVGVEIGQVAFVGLVLALVASFRALEMNWWRWAREVPTYAVGALGAFWTIQRVAVL